MVLEGDPVHAGRRIDLGTGEVWPGSPYDDAVEVYDEELDDSARLLP